METIGIIGLGLVGSAIAQRLLSAGYQVLGFDTDASRRPVLESQGGRWAGTAHEVAAGARIVLLSLPDSNVVGEVVQQIRQSLPADAVLIDTTTGDPTETSLLAEELAGYGLHHIDATIVGSSEQVRRGEAVVLAGGAQETFDDLRDVLATFSRRLMLLGPSGCGQRMKLVVNLVLGLNRAALAEGLALAEMLRIAPRQALEVLQETAAYSRVMETKGPKMVAGDFTPEARLRQHLKDVRLMLSQASLRGRALPLSALHAELLQRLVDAGCGDLDNSAIVQAFRE